MSWMPPKEDMTPYDEIADETFQKDLLLLENDLDALGWDQPGRLYAIGGKPGNYWLELVSEITHHPVDHLRDIVKNEGFKLKPEFAGMAVAVEGWRHPDASDLEESGGQTWEHLRGLAVLCGFDPDNPEEHDKMLHHINNALAKVFGGVRPSANPDRREVRTIMAVMRDGTGAGVNRTRGRAAEPLITAKEGRVVRALQAALDGAWPADVEMNERTPDRH